MLMDTLSNHGLHALSDSLTMTLEYITENEDLLIMIEDHMHAIQSNFELRTGKEQQNIATSVSLTHVAS